MILTIVAAFGSSPLARGTRNTIKHFNILIRLIPARAGNTISGRSIAAPPSAHPRSRGEHY